MNWQGMETAPKDGTRVLLSSDSQTVHIGYWNPEGTAWVDEDDSFEGKAHHLKETGVWNSGSGWLQPNEVIAWMPIPEAAPGTANAEPPAQTTATPEEK